MEGTALLGMGLSALAMVGCHSALVFAALFLLYLSLYTAGGTFMGFQWDIFLLETGVLTTLYAPLWLDSSAPCPGPKLLLRWLAFKFMLSSGVVKLTAMDSTWQNLTAMEYHFATTCLATSQAWLLHNLPPWALRLSTAVMFVTEIPAAFLLLAPWRMARRASAFLQVRCTLLPEETSPRRAAVWSGLGETGRRKPAGGSTTRVNAGRRGTRGGEAGDGTPPFDTLVVLVSYQALRERTENAFAASYSIGVVLRAGLEQADGAAIESSPPTSQRRVVTSHRDPDLPPRTLIPELEPAVDSSTSARTGSSAECTLASRGVTAAHLSSAFVPSRLRSDSLDALARRAHFCHNRRR